MIKLEAYAKVNLTLEVLAKRPDGYHEIASLLQTVSLSDTLTFKPGESLDFHCDAPTLRTPDNLVVRAAKLLQETTGCGRGVSINLIKRIPVAAGLGSGATDAAATLVGLNHLWELNLSYGELRMLAAQLGSDIAFFLYGGTAMAKGRGEVITALAPAPVLWLALLKPEVGPITNKTGRLYLQLNSSHYTSGQYTSKLVAHLNVGGGVEASFLFNVFERVAFDFFPGLSDYRSRLLTAGAGDVHLAGSGPAMFGTVNDRNEGEAVVGRLKEEGLEAYLVHSVGDEKWQKIS